MLRIRATEKRRLEEAEREAFVDHVFTILRDTWVNEVGALGEEPVKGQLRSWTAVLEERGVVTEQPIAKALNVFFATSVDFHEDPTQAPWITSVLEADGGTEISKAYQLEVALFLRYKRVAEAE